MGISGQSVIREFTYQMNQFKTVVFL